MLKVFLRPSFLGAIVILGVLTGIFGWYSLTFNSLKDKNQKLFTKKDPFVNQQIKTSIESPDFTLVQENSLVGISCSQIVSSKVLGALMGEDLPEERKEVTEYVVQEGDTISSIAEKFNVSLNTLLWTNDLNNQSIIKLGQKLIILPISGVIHHVQKGDTLSGITSLYKTDISKIITFNNLSNENDIYIGDILIIPDGIKPAPSYIASGKTTTYSQIPLASSYFIYPLASPYRTTQGLHWYNAVDFANLENNCGRPVFAAAGGEVLNIKYGYNMGAGNYIRILHPNGLITHYGHLQNILVTPGQQVSQGDIIGLTGYSGKTIPAGPGGCHLHFALYSDQGNPPRNPFAQ